jgi:dinuclear metal center YbgI/SA1388 family protein
MTNVETIAAFLDRLAPPQLAESWDNVGLLVGDPQAPARRVMTCLTVTAATAAEAVEQSADLIVTHHPLPFRPLKRITTATPEGRYLLQLLAANVAIYSAHTAFDSTAAGINQRLAEGLGLTNIMPLVPTDEPGTLVGGGRYGSCGTPTTVGDLAERLKQFLSIDAVHAVGKADRRVDRVAVACGSAGEFLDAARRDGCDTFVTGETSFHTCLAAEANDVAVLLTGHFASERFAMECLADVLAAEFPQIDVWASREERDPLHLL